MILQESVTRKAVEFVKNNKGKLIVGALGAGAAYEGMKAVEHNYDQKIDKLTPEFKKNKQAADQIAGKQRKLYGKLANEYLYAKNDKAQSDFWQNTDPEKSEKYADTYDKKVADIHKNINEYNKLANKRNDYAFQGNMVGKQINDLATQKNKIDSQKGRAIAAAGILGAATGHYLLDRKSKNKGKSK